MEALFDVRTLFACNAALTAYAGFALLFYKANYKTYPGYSFWMAGTFCVACAYVLLSISAVLPIWPLLFVHFFIYLAELLRLDAVSRFTGMGCLARRYYALPFLFLVPIVYFAVIHESALVRNVLIGVFSFTLITVTAIILFKRINRQNRNLYIAAGLLYFLYGLLLLLHSVSWIVTPRASVIESGVVQQLFFFLFIIFEMGLGVTLLMMNSQRLELDLVASRDDLLSTVLKLQTARNELKVLSGMLPICSSCKKIRDDQGYWNRIESYISERSEAEFSHGICPECMKALYPDLVDEDGMVKLDPRSDPQA